MLTLLLLLSLYGFPSVAARTAGKTRRAKGMDARVFLQYRMYCRKIPPTKRTPKCEARRGAKAGCAFFWLLFFAQAKKSNSLRSEAGAKAFDFAFNCFLKATAKAPSPPPLSQRERGFKPGLLVLLLLFPSISTATDLYSTIATSLVRPDGARLVPYQWPQEPDIIALYFGADWCSPCHAFTPQLREVYKSLQSAGANTEVVYVSLDTTEADMRRYMRQSFMPWPAIPPRRLRSLPALNALAGPAPPNLVLIDRSGHVLASGWDGRRWLGLQQVLHTWMQHPINGAPGP